MTKTLFAAWLVATVVAALLLVLAGFCFETDPRAFRRKVGTMPTEWREAGDSPSPAH
jgi:AraC-like DNA-binding protein